MLACSRFDTSLRLFLTAKRGSLYDPDPVPAGTGSSIMHDSHVLTTCLKSFAFTRFSVESSYEIVVNYLQSVLPFSDISDFPFNLLFLR